MDALRLDEMKNIVAQGKAQDVIKHSDVKYVVPWSAEMIALVSRINKNDYNSVKKANRKYPLPTMCSFCPSECLCDTHLVVLSRN